MLWRDPVVKSLRGIQPASELDQVQRRFGSERVSRGSLREASQVCAPERLHALVGDLAAPTLPLVHGKEADAFRGLTAVEGSRRPALPQMAWALGLDPQHRAAQCTSLSTSAKASPSKPRGRPAMTRKPSNGA